MHRSIAALALLVSALPTASLAAPSTMPQLTPVAPAPASLPVIPWLAPTANPQLADLGEINRPDGTLLATVAAGWNSDALQLRILVNDSDHVPAPDDKRLWSADSIELGIDAAGDRSGMLPPETTGPIAADDFKFIFGLIETGPAVNSLASSGKPDLAILRERLAIKRPDNDHTLYEINLPWSQLNVTAGTCPTLGLDLQINDRNTGDTDKTAFPWGTGLKGGFTAARLKLFALGTPAPGFAAVDWSNTLAWSANDPLVLRVGLRSDQAVTINLILNGTPSTISIPGGPGFRFETLSLPAQPDAASLSAQVGEQAPVLAEQTAATAIFKKLEARLAEVIDRPNQHPLFLRHLRSLSALVATDWGRVQLLRNSDPRRALASIGYYRDLLSGLNADAADWDAYLDGRRSLVMAYVSPHDQSTQYYWFGLPRDWDATKTYPLFFELHGAGGDHPMGGIANRLAATAKRQDGFGYDSPKVYAEIDRSGYWVHPFGRGNLGYKGIARIDVLEAYDDVQTLVNIDPNRRYLYGFSMGGQGTFNLGARTPSRWAAACSIAPALWKDSTKTPILSNWALLPYKLMTGEEDRFIKDYHQIIAGLAQYDIHPEARSIPSMGHSYRGDLQKEKIDWLKTHVRTRPDSFTFVTDDNLTNTCWGITLNLPFGEYTLARVTYRREGQTVHLTSEGTSSINLDVSEPDGLGLTGEITVIWNGQTAYTGPAKNLTLQN